MKIGLISDTHGKLPPKIFEIFADVDLIIHAGDVGSVNVLSDLKAIAPVKAVYGNMDHFPLLSKLPRIDFIKAGQLTICVTHIVNNMKSFAFELFKMSKKVDVVVFGHTHRSVVTEYNNILFVNPGSVSYPRGSGISVAVLSIQDKKASAEFFNLG